MSENFGAGGEVDVVERLGRGRDSSRDGSFFGVASYVRYGGVERRTYIRHTGLEFDVDIELFRCSRRLTI